MSEEDDVRQLVRALQEARVVFKTEFWKLQPDWMAQAALIYILIRMNDVLGGLSRMGRRIDFNDDMDQEDITALVAFMRNLTCHFGSKSRVLGNNNRITMIMVGAVKGMQFGDRVVENPYRDDVMYSFGQHTILIGRHLLRAADEAEAILSEVVKEKGYRILPALTVDSRRQ